MSIGSIGGAEYYHGRATEQPVTHWQQELSTKTQSHEALVEVLNRELATEVDYAGRQWPLTQMSNNLTAERQEFQAQAARDIALLGPDADLAGLAKSLSHMTARETLVIRALEFLVERLIPSQRVRVLQIRVDERKAAKDAAEVAAILSVALTREKLAGVLEHEGSVLIVGSTSETAINIHLDLSDKWARARRELEDELARQAKIRVVKASYGIVNSACVRA